MLLGCSSCGVLCVAAVTVFLHVVNNWRRMRKTLSRSCGRVSGTSLIINWMYPIEKNN